MTEPSQLLSAIQGRKTAGGITLASTYLDTVWSCLGDQRCAARWGDLDGAQLAKAFDEARNKLVYRTDEMVVEGGCRHVDGVPTDAFGQFKSVTKPTPKACMDFECVLTATKKDRDGDVLESKGAEVDPRMALLWQHIPLQPIGKLVSVISQDERRVVTHFAIADTELGRDAAQLVEFGALRVSHGFKPLAYEPLKKGKDDDTFEPGYHVTKYVVMEGSLVSVPSNDAAVITAFSREKLHHPLVKEWAHALQKQCPPVVVSGFIAPPAAAPSPGHAEQLIGDRAGAAADLSTGSARCACGKSAAAITKAVGDDSVSGGSDVAPVNVPPGICQAPGCKAKCVKGEKFCAKHLKERNRHWEQANADLLVPVAVLNRLMPGLAAKAQAKGLPGLKLGTLARRLKEPANLDELCGKLDGEEHPHTACVDMVEGWGDSAPDDADAFCGWLTSQCGLRSYHADISWRETTMALTKAAPSLRAKNVRLIKESHDLFGEIHDHDKTQDSHKAMCKSGMDHCKAAMGSQEDDDGDSNGDDDGDEAKPTKAGRVLSAARMDRVKSAYSLASTMSDDDGLHRPGKSMAREAKAYLKAVVDSANPEVTDEPNPGVSDKPNPGVDGKAADCVAAMLVGHLWQRSPIELATLCALEQAVPVARRAAEEQLLAAAADSLT